MSRFRGTVEGGRGSASRLGGRASGLTTNCNGWTRGVRVQAFVDEVTDEDVFLVYATNGSSPAESMRLLGTLDADGFDPEATP